MRFLRILSLFILTISVQFINAQSVSDKMPIELPYNTIEGWLNNGLHYMIRSNSHPSNTVEMRLVMRLGSVQESNKEKGVAHFLEHAAFFGTENFPERKMIEYWESVGMKFGRDINAYTGYDRTIYTVTVPVDNQYDSAIDTSLIALRDWLCGITFYSERVKKERGVILEELRGYQLEDNFYSLKIGNGLFADHLPLGREKDIKRVDDKKLKGFYNHWYTPQLASIVVVGMIDTTDVKQKIEKIFSNIPTHTPDGYEVYPLTYKKGTQIKEVRDTLLNRSKLELIIPHKAIVGTTLETVYRRELDNLLVRALSNRFSARGMKVSLSDSWYLSDKKHLVFSFSGKNREELLQQISELVSELHYVWHNGFAPEEMADVKQSMLHSLNISNDILPSAMWCDDFTDYIISGDRYIHSEEEMERLIDKVLRTEARQLKWMLKRWIDYKNETLLVAYTNCYGTGESISVKDIDEAWEQGGYLEALPFVYKKHEEEEEEIISTPECLKVEKPYNPECVESTYFYENLSVSEINLTNGLQILLRPTQDGSDRVQLTLFARGGVADLSNEELYKYDSTAGYMEMGVIDAVPYDTITTYMLQNSIAINTGISPHWHELLASSPTEKASEMFNLVYEKMHRPERCYADFEEVKTDEIESFGDETLLQKMMKRDAERMLVNRMDYILGNTSHKNIRARRVEDVMNLNLDSIATYYTRLFSNPKGTTLLLTGCFNTEEMAKLLISTFASMSSTTDACRFLSNPYELPLSYYSEAFESDNPTQTAFDYILAGNYTPSLKNSLILKLMRDILQDRFLKVFRERENIAYSPYVGLVYNGMPQQTFYFDFMASVDNHNMGYAEELISTIITSLKSTPVSEAELQAMKRSFIVTKRQVLNEQATADWKNNLVNILKSGESLADFDRYEEVLSEITPETIQQAFNDYLHPERAILLYIGDYKK
ncbi:MAG: insulinase family protein [Bacteroidales bacterium]|nr:insulinase family protein [Bacteroidales bacterium]